MIKDQVKITTPNDRIPVMICNIMPNIIKKLIHINIKTINVD